MKNLLSMILASLLLVGCQGGSSQQSLKVGVIMPMSGPVALLGEETQLMHNAILNKYFEGQDIEIVYADGQCSGSEAVTAYQKLVNVDQVDVILGGVCSTESLAIAPLLEANSMLAVSGVSTSSELDGLSSNFFSFANNANLPSLEMVKQASVFDRVAIISEQVDYTMDVHNVMLQGLGDKIVMAEIFEPGSTDLRNSIVKIINSQPDAIVLNPNAGITPKVLLNQLAEYSDELDEIQIISQLAYLGSDSREDAESLAEGMMIIDVPDIIDADFKEFKASIGSELQMHSDFLIASTHDAMLNLISFALKNDVDDPSFISNFANTKFQGFIADGKSFDKGSFLQGLKAGVFKIVDGNPVLQ